MAHYRLYLLDRDNHIIEGIDLDCFDDSAAVSLATTHATGRGMELWHGVRRVMQARATEHLQPAHRPLRLGKRGNPGVLADPSAFVESNGTCTLLGAIPNRV